MSLLKIRTVLLLESGLVLAPVACAGQSYPIDVTGNSGPCKEIGYGWSGDALPAVPGTVLERTVTCPAVVMSDERLSGTFDSSFRCEFVQQGDSAVGQCTQESTVTNSGGTWRREGRIDGDHGGHGKALDDRRGREPGGHG